jgi:hypothetical protein
MTNLKKNENKNNTLSVLNKIYFRKLGDSYHTLCMCYIYVSRSIVINLNIDIENQKLKRLWNGEGVISEFKTKVACHEKETVTCSSYILPPFFFVFVAG